MTAARLPYRDDTFDGEDLAGPDVAGVAAARAKVADAEEAWRQAVYWNRRATPSNRDIRGRHLQACTRAALEAAAALRRLEAGQ